MVQDVPVHLLAPGRTESEWNLGSFWGVENSTLGKAPYSHCPVLDTGHSSFLYFCRWMNWDLLGHDSVPTPRGSVVHRKAAGENSWAAEDAQAGKSPWVRPSADPLHSLRESYPEEGVFQSKECPEEGATGHALLRDEVCIAQEQHVLPRWAIERDVHQTQVSRLWGTQGCSQALGNHCFISWAQRDILVAFGPWRGLRRNSVSWNSLFPQFYLKNKCVHFKPHCTAWYKLTSKMPSTWVNLVTFVWTPPLASLILSLS